MFKKNVAGRDHAWRKGKVLWFADRKVWCYLRGLADSWLLHSHSWGGVKVYVGMSLRCAFFEGFVVVGDWSSSCARQFWGSGNDSVVVFVVAVVPVHSFASAVTSSETGAGVSDGCDVLSSGEHGVDEADSSWSSPSQRSDDVPFVLLGRRFLESRSMGLLMAVPLS